MSEKDFSDELKEKKKLSEKRMPEAMLMAGLALGMLFIGPFVHPIFALLGFGLLIWSFLWGDGEVGKKK